MPHVVLDGPVDISGFCRAYRPVTQHHPGGILKLQTAYVGIDGTEVLIEAISVEDGPPVRFLVQILCRGDRTTVKVYPGTDPEKTDGVKKIIALTARMLKECSPGVRYGTTNLGGFLL